MNYWVWLSSIDGISPYKKNMLLKSFKTPEKIYKTKKDKLIKVEGITEENVECIEKSKDTELIKKYETYINKNNIKIINIYEKEYPEMLKQIYDPPVTLFCIGDVSLLKRTSIAIVGSRHPSTYGMQVAENFSNELNKNGITIVSGMARGIDTYAHMGTFENGVNTIAVLGNGVDIVYPNENVKVYNEIAKNGLIVSEYIVGTKPDAWRFPARNRIISGLSDGVLVIEAKKKSGTMITTDFALEQGRELYVIPGNINSINSEGTNNLIKQGAKVVTCVDDILEDFIF